MHAWNWCIPSALVCTHESFSTTVYCCLMRYLCTPVVFCEVAMLEKCSYEKFCAYTQGTQIQIKVVLLKKEEPSYVGNIPV